jgi:hypothetical protein
LQNCEEKNPYLDFRNLEQEEATTLIHIVSDACEHLLEQGKAVLIKVGVYEQSMQ